MIVFDASAVYDAISDLEIGRQARLAMLEAEIAAPHLIDLELISTCRRKVLHGELTEQAAVRQLDRVQRVPIARFAHEPLAARIWQLRENLTPYDASYVALAEALRGPLYTSDSKIADAPGIRCEVRLLPS